MATVATKAAGGKVKADGKAATTRGRASAAPTALAPVTATGRKKRAATAAPTATIGDGANPDASHAGSGYTARPTVTVGEGDGGETAPATLPARTAKRLADELKLVAESARLRVVWLLRHSGETNVGAMCRAIGVSQPALSHTLSILRHAGVIEARRVAKNNLYSLTPKGDTLARLVIALESAE